MNPYQVTGKSCPWAQNSGWSGKKMAPSQIIVVDHVENKGLVLRVS